MSQKSALITGITGQDGSYLAEFLLEKGYRVYGLIRRSSTVNFERISHIQRDIELLSGDLLDQNSLSYALEDSAADEVYNLGAQSFIPASWDQPILTGEITALGTTRILEAIRRENPAIRFYQASTSELFGAAFTSPQNEDTAFNPRSPYGVAKQYAHWITVNYRQNYDLFACAGILFNHESPRRGLEFVTRKITHGVALIKIRARKKATPRQFRCPTRLGVCRRFRAGYVAYVAARRSGGLCYCNGGRPDHRGFLPGGL